MLSPSSVSARWIRPRYSSAITRSSRTTSGTTASSMRLVRRSSIRSWKSSLAEKRLKEYAAGIKVKKAQVEETEALMTERRKDLEAKQTELQSIEAETASQVAEFTAQAAKAQAKIDKRLLEAYQRIRHNVRNGLAVVTVRRDACGGCFNRIPPQRQMEIRQGKKIIICEYCGRILVADPEEQQ